MLILIDCKLGFLYNMMYEQEYETNHSTKEYEQNIFVEHKINGGETIIHISLTYVQKPSEVRM